MFVCRNVRKNQGRLVGRCFFFLVRACENLLFSESKKTFKFSNIHAFHIFMFTHVFHVPEVLRGKKKSKKQTALVQKITGRSEDFFFLRNYKKKKKKVGRFFEGRSGYGKQTFFMPNYETTLYRWHSRGGAAANAAIKYCAGFRLTCRSPLCRYVCRVIIACCFRVTALSSHAALALSQSGIAPELNRIQLSAVCRCGQSGGVIDLLARCCLPLGFPSAASGACAVVQKSPSKRQCRERQASLKAALIKALFSNSGKWD